MNHEVVIVLVMLWLLHAGFGQKFDAMLMCFLCSQDVFANVLVFPI